jgi:hypothetical protein
MTRLAGRGRREDPVEPAVKVVKILRQGCVLPRPSPSPDRGGAQQQPPKRCAERRFAIFDGICRVAQQMRRADLPFDTMAALAAQHVETQTPGRDSPNSAVTTALPRLGLMTCSTAIAATTTPAAEQAHLGHIRFNWRSSMRS